MDDRVIQLLTVFLGLQSLGLCGFCVYCGFVLLNRGAVALAMLDD
jgi:hypothetical protein